MLTDDVQIDRRILLEGESLYSRGHEIILLAGHAADAGDFERIGNVKVERIRTPDQSVLEVYLVRMSTMVNKGLNWVNSAMRWALGSRSRGNSKSFSKVIRVIASSIEWIVLTVPIRVNQRLATLGVRAIRRMRRLSLREQVMIDRISFYRPDVIHAHDLPQLRVGAVSKRRLRVPLVYDAHELYPEIATLNAWQKRSLSRRERRYVRCADAVITVNKYIAAEMKRRYGIDTPQVILNATNWPSELAMGKPFRGFRERFDIPAGHRILLFQGWMSLQRGLQPLVRALSILPADLHLVFMGYGEAKDELSRIAHDVGVESRVHFMDAVPQSELLAWTSSADVGVIPYQPVDLNNYYCSPNKLFEFIQAELPMVANDLPFLRDLIVGEGFGVVHRLKEPADYAVAISEIFEAGKIERCKLCLKSRRGAYSWSVEERKLLDIYAKLNMGSRSSAVAATLSTGNG